MGAVRTGSVVATIAGVITDMSLMSVITRSFTLAMTFAVLGDKLWSTAMTFGCRLFVGVVFLASGITKVRFFEAFCRAVASYRFFRLKATVRIVAFSVTLCEVLAGAGLLVSYTASISSLVGLALLVVFTFIVISALLRSKRPERCGCMIVIGHDPFGWHIVFRNLGFMLLLLPSVSLMRAFPSCLSGFVLLAVSFFLAGSKAAGETYRPRESAMLP